MSTKKPSKRTPVSCAWCGEPFTFDQGLRGRLCPACSKVTDAEYRARQFSWPVAAPVFFPPALRRPQASRTTQHRAITKSNKRQRTK